MPGIGSISGQRAQVKTERGDGQSFGRELWLKGGEVANVMIVTSGGEDDGSLDQFWLISPRMVTDQGKQFFPTILCEDGNTPPAEFSTEKPQHKFGMWVYCYNIVHPKNDPTKDFTEKVLPSGTKQYIEEINDFVVFQRGFGRGDYLWNSVVTINDEQGTLTGFLVKIRRQGDGMQDTIFTVTAVPERVLTLDDELAARAAELPTILEFYGSRSARALSQARGETEESAPATKNVADTLDEGDDFFGGDSTGEEKPTVVDTDIF